MEPENSPLTEDHILAWARIVRTAEDVVGRVEAAFKASGLPPLAWYDLLLELNRAGEEGMRPYRLQEEMLLPQYNISRLIDRLAKAGYLERETCEDDRRGQNLRITGSGRNLLRRMWPVYRGVLETSIGAQLDAAAARSLARLLGRLATRPSPSAGSPG